MSALKKETFSSYSSNGKKAEIHKKKKKGNSFKPIEFINALLVLGVIVFLATKIIGNYSTIYENSKELQTIESSITDLERQNKELTSEVEELSRYDRIMKIAKSMGLQLDEDNVKVVEE